MAEQNFDLVVIGGGPGGYVAAIRAAQLGMNVACVEKRGALGGTCLNVGCMPSKALLYSSEKYHEAQHDLKKHGISVQDVKIDIAALMARKNKIVDGLTGGIEFLFKKNKISYFVGTGKFTGPNDIIVTAADGSEQKIQAKNIMIATGSDVASLPGLDIDENILISSTGALSLESVPEHLVVIGGGVIGLEMGSVWNRLGAKVTVVEFADRVTPGMDGDICKEFQRTLKKQGMTFHMKSKVTQVEQIDGKAKVHFEPAAGGDAKIIDADKVLVAVGRKPYTDGLGLEAVGIETDARGMIPVNDHFQTSHAHIYAIGDVIRGPMLAHKAEEEGVAAAEFIAGQKPHVNYDVIPSIVYTTPEVAAIGKTEEQLKEAGIAYNAGKFPFQANSRAKATSELGGFVKILADQKTDRILGVHIIGPDAGTLIHEAVVAMEFGGSAEDLARTCHGHPTLNEAVKEAALTVDKRPIHV